MARFIRTASYNMRGLNQGKLLLSDLCKQFDIIALQEHWLTDYNIHNLINIDNEFIGIAKSAMAVKVESGFLVGRPFGGLAILVRKSICDTVTFLSVDSSCRSMSTLITLRGGYKLLVIVVYLPCFDASPGYQVDLLECVSFIENAVASTDHNGVVLLGDCNFECTPLNVGYAVFKGMLDDTHMICCEDLAYPQVEYTYFQDTMNRQSLIDHIFVSSHLYSRVIDYSVVESGVNLSDHLPVTCTIAFPFRDCSGLNPASHRCNSHKFKPGISRWDKADLRDYYKLTGSLLQNVAAPLDLLCDDKTDGYFRVNQYYDAIVSSLLAASHSCVPVLRGNALKPYWSSELQQLKENSIHAHGLWIANGKPRDGWINEFRLRSKYKYKHAIRMAAINFELDLDDELSQHFLRKDMDKFWLKWQKRFSKKNSDPSHINGYTKEGDIANVFNEVFASNYFNSYDNCDVVNELTDKVYHNNSLVCGDWNVFDISDVEDALHKLSVGKAAGIDGIVKEHLIYSHPAVIVHLKLLFNMICCTGVVPDCFGVGLTIPLLKDRLGDLCDASNYRAITLSPIIAKLFEHCIAMKYQLLMNTNDLQFGFKKNSGCANAIFVMRECVDYFTQHGSDIFMAALDAKKAFDRVNHLKLFNILLDKKFPVYIVRLIMNWYGKIVNMVRWGSSLSAASSIRSGVRQGGVLSPLFFNMYIDVLVNKLSDSDLGCHVRNIYIGCIVYADDILLLSASVVHLQRMLDMCYVVGNSCDIVFNPKKSYLFKVGRGHQNTVCELTIGNEKLIWCERLKYLGVTFLSGCVLDVDTSVNLRRFYSAANGILSNVKYASEVTKLHLLESFCLPLLTYVCEALSYGKKKEHQLQVAWNNGYRKIFHYNAWESVKVLQYFCERMDLYHLFLLRRLKFLYCLNKSSNVVSCVCLSVYKSSKEFSNICTSLGVCINYHSFCEIRHCIAQHFVCTVAI